MPKTKPTQIHKTEPAPEPPEIRYELATYVDGSGEDVVELTADQFAALKAHVKTLTEKPAPDQPSNRPLTSLLMECFEFDNSSSSKEKQLLIEILRDYRKNGCSFACSAAAEGLNSLGIPVNSEDMEKKRFMELLAKFSYAVSGYGYNGFREQMITALLVHGNDNMTFEDVLGIVNVEYSERHAGISAAREALENYPEELAGAIEKANEKLARRQTA